MSKISLPIIFYLKHPKHSIFRARQARQAYKPAKFIAHASSPGTLFRKALEALEYLKHASTPST